MSTLEGWDALGRPDSLTRERTATHQALQGCRSSSQDLADDIVGITQLLHSVRRLEQVDHRALPSRHTDRDQGHVASRAEDPDNAIIRFCRVEGAANGPLNGIRVGVKDNIAVAGVPMTDGAHTMPQFVPREDAVVVERLLDAGATIVAKTNLVPSEFGPTRNPRNPRFHAGGSSSGSAAAVAGGIVDIALGADQGGSIRIPASWCGIVGMKPTHGLVPTYGLTYWDHTLDHIGPMTTTVAENAAMLTVLAGSDWRDPQWVRSNPVAALYGHAADHNVNGLRIGFVVESLKPAGCTSATLEAFANARKKLSELGADVVPVSVPFWPHAEDIWLAAVTFGLTTMANTFGQGHGHLGRIDVSKLVARASSYVQGPRISPFGGRILSIAFEHLRDSYSGLHFGLAQNLRLELRQQIDDILTDVDLLITPTSPTVPVKIAAPPDTSRLFPPWLSNTCPLNLTGHPALTVPSGPGDNDMPTGLQIIGRRFDEYTVYRAGFAFERN